MKFGTVRIPCQFCQKQTAKQLIKQHENACGENPDNKGYCPNCGKQINTRYRQTCSYSCSNSYFRVGPNHGNWNENRYASTCFFYHQKQCIVCKEELIVEVHHLDGDNTNNKADNLIPLCPTHHQYWHSKHKHLVEDIVYEYIEHWKKDNNWV